MSQIFSRTTGRAIEFVDAINGFKTCGEYAEATRDLIEQLNYGFDYLNGR